MDVEAVMARCESLNIGDNFSLATFSLGHLDDSRNSRAAIRIQNADCIVYFRFYHFVYF